MLRNLLMAAIPAVLMTGSVFANEPTLENAFATNDVTTTAELDLSALEAVLTGTTEANAEIDVTPTVGSDENPGVDAEATGWGGGGHRRYSYGHRYYGYQNYGYNYYQPRYYSYGCWW